MKGVVRSAADRTAILVASLAAGISLHASGLTAFDLIREANEYVGKDAQDQVVQIRSDRSVGGVTPAVWYVAYYDPDATFKVTEVKFGAGKKMDVKRPARVWGRIGSAGAVLDRKRMRVDSDRALQIALKEPLLEKLTIKATQLVLNRAAGEAVPGGQGLPVWRVDLWAARLADPNRMTRIGHILVSAEDGKVLKTDVNINRVD